MPDVPNRRQRQGEFARVLSRLGQEHRREAERLLGDPPDVANIPDSFWDRVEEETSERIAEQLLLLFLLLVAANRGSRDRANTPATTYSTVKSIDAGARHARFARDRLERASVLWRDRAARDLETDQAMIREKTLAVWGPARMDGLAATLTTDAATAGSEEVKRQMSEGTPDKPPQEFKLVWQLGPCNHCVFCPLVAGTSEDFYGQFIGGPPAHYGCCCSTILMPADRVTRVTDPDRVARAARESGVFGFERVPF